MVHCTAMEMENVTGNITSSDSMNSVRGGKATRCGKPEDFGGWHKNACFNLNMQRFDIYTFAVMEGQETE